MSKKILRIEFDYPLSLIGISSSIKDYRLCWYINNEFPFNFIRSEDIVFTNDQGEEMYFSKFESRIKNLEAALYLFSNKCSNGYLIPESKESDYFFMCTEELPDQEYQDILRALNKIEVIQTAYIIDPYSLKSKENLLFF